MSRTWTITARIFVSPPGVRGCSSMVEPLPSKQITRVRFPSSAPELGKPRAKWPGASALPPSRSRGLGERGGVDDAAIAQTPVQHDNHKFASMRTSRGMSPYFLGVAMPYASNGFARSKGSMTVPSQSSQSPARVARSWRAARI